MDPEGKCAGRQPGTSHTPGQPRSIIFDVAGAALALPSAASIWHCRAHHCSSPRTLCSLPLCAARSVPLYAARSLPLCRNCKPPPVFLIGSGDRQRARARASLVVARGGAGADARRLLVRALLDHHHNDHHWLWGHRPQGKSFADRRSIAPHYRQPRYQRCAPSARVGWSGVGWRSPCRHARTIRVLYACPRATS